MKYNYHLIGSLIFVSIICLGTQCRKDEIVYQYSFSEKVDLFPAEKSYNIGDTIWIQYVNPTGKLFDKNSHQYISIDTVQIGIQIGYNSLYNAPIKPSGGFCDFISGNMINQSLFRGDFGTSVRFGFGCNMNNSFDFKIGIIPIQIGVYYISFGSASNNVQGCPNKIVRFPYSLLEYRYNNQDCNKDIFLQIPVNSRTTSPKDYYENQIDQKQAYIVKIE